MLADLVLLRVPPAHLKASVELIIQEIRDVIERKHFLKSFAKKLINLPFTSTISSWTTRWQIGRHPSQSECGPARRSTRGNSPTISSGEGWHYGFKACFSGSMPNAWLLWRNLDKSSKMQKFNPIQETGRIVVLEAAPLKQLQIMLIQFKSKLILAFSVDRNLHLVARFYGCFCL